MRKYIYAIVIGLFAYAALAYGQSPTPIPAEAVTVPPEVPDMLVKAMALVSSLPVVGPILVEIAKYLGLISSVLTIIVTAILGVIKALQAALPLLNLVNLASKVAAFENSKVMYYLKMLSMYNAKKTEAPKVAAPK